MLKKNVQTYIVSCLAFGLVFLSPVAVRAQDESRMGALLEQIAALREVVEELQAQISAMQEEQQALIEETARLKRELRIGMEGEDVRILQEVLATDPTIYPEGLVTGYFGPLTQAAVRKFKLKFEIEGEDGLGSHALDVLNHLITEGAGNSGNIPPGLLIAPGLERIRCEIEMEGVDVETKCKVKGGDDEDDKDDDEDETEVEIEYEDGVYTVEGKVTVPTECHNVEVEVDVTEGEPDNVLVDVTTESTSEDCSDDSDDEDDDEDDEENEDTEEKDFEAEFEAGADAEIVVKVNGESVDFELDRDVEEDDSDDEDEDESDENDSEDDE